MPAFDITESDQTIDHGLGDQDVIVQAWQNGYIVQPGITRTRTEGELRIFAVGVSERNPLRLLVLPVSTETPSTVKPSKEKTSATSKEKPKRRTKAS